MDTTNLLIKPVFNDKKSYALVFSSDNNYLPYFAVALKSLICNSKEDEYYDIILFENDISERYKALLSAMLPQNFSLRFFNLDNYIQTKLGNITLKAMSYWSVSMYYRLFIPFVMQGYERVMYADSDICFNEGIKDFYNQSFEDKSLIAVLDAISPIIKEEKPKIFGLFKSFGIKNPELYFNSGILLFNIKSVDLNVYLEKLKTALSFSKLCFPDQDVLNIVFEDKKKLAEMKWNCQSGTSLLKQKDFAKYPDEYREEYIKTIKNPAIVHYTGALKPWNFPENEAAEIFWHYARLTPFYEEILFRHLDKRFKKLWNKRENMLYYWRYKVLSRLSFGKLKAHYKAEKSKYKALLKY